MKMSMGVKARMSIATIVGKNEYEVGEHRSSKEFVLVQASLVHQSIYAINIESCKELTQCAKFKTVSRACGFMAGWPAYFLACYSSCCCSQ